MDRTSFKAMVVEETPEKEYVRGIQQRSIDDLPEGDVLVQVKYSSLNYKDTLSAVGNKGVTKNYPHTPGIDAAGIVAEDRSGTFNSGEEVIVTSYDLGMNTPGGFGQYIRVPADWVVKRPGNLTLRESMIYGTAGFTAALSVEKLISTVAPDDGEILVSGASGGVGSMAVSFLVKSGYTVVGVGGKSDDEQYIKNLGARAVISIDEATDESNRPLLKEKWAGAVDTVGGPILATTVRSTRLGGNVTCCGNVASGDLPLTIYPFILRGITLFGIDSQHCPMDTRIKIWHRLAGEWKLDTLDRLATEISIEELDAYLDRSLQGKLQGRTVVNISD